MDKFVQTNILLVYDQQPTWMSNQYTQQIMMDQNT